MDEARDDELAAEDAGILDWLRWWHWLILGAMFVFGLFYFPLWRFEQKWKTIKAGDSFETVTRLLGQPIQTYTVLGAAPGTPIAAYTYSRYWRSYEVQVDPMTDRVVGLVTSGGTQPPAPATK